MAMIDAAKPVMINDEPQFGKVLSTVLSPARPLQSPQYLKGRDANLKDIQRALYQPGRHVFIHGFRGVGKTSLAQTAAFLVQSADMAPIVVGCGDGTTFSSVLHDIVRKGLNEDHRLIKETKDAKFSFMAAIKGIGASAEKRTSMESGKSPPPLSINEAVNQLATIVGKHSPEPVVLIDEFDKITDKKEQGHFADFIKQVSDQHVPVRFIFCGVGDTIDDLMKAHKSVNRYLHPVKLERLAWTPRIEIIKVAAEVLGIEIDETSTYRICMISDGFPHYIHLIAEKLFWLVYEARNGGQVKAPLFEKALHNASDALEPELKTPYEKATKKYTDSYEEVLFSVADTHELQRRSTDIYKSYQRIMGQLGKEPLDRTKFNGSMNRLKQDGHAEILVGSRQGWYEFREKILRGYTRLRAAQKGLDLEVEHPGQAAKYSYKGVEG